MVKKNHMDLSIYLSETHEIPQKSEDLPWISPPNIENIEDIEHEI